MQTLRARLAAALAALRGRLPAVPPAAPPVSPDLTELRRLADQARAAAEALERARANLAAIQAAMQSRAG